MQQEKHFIETLKHGPDTSEGPAVIDNIPGGVRPRVVEALQRRAYEGHKKYGTFLSQGFPHARGAMAQEICDALMYGFAMGLTMESPWMQQLEGMALTLLED